MFGCNEKLAHLRYTRENTLASSKETIVNGENISTQLVFKCISTLVHLDTPKGPSW